MTLKILGSFLRTAFLLLAGALLGVYVFHREHPYFKEFEPDGFKPAALRGWQNSPPLTTDRYNAFVIRFQQDSFREKGWNADHAAMCLWLLSAGREYGHKECLGELP